jgi:glycosyltransferase involved in cell wall biosynthesis
MHILIVLTYYRPHTSGLTIYAERLARAMVKRGHEVIVLTSQYDPALPREEVNEGVRIVRAPVLFRISKGVIMPTFGVMANHLVSWADVIHLHLPQFDAAGVALRGRLLKKPTVITYHCDLLMPRGVISMAANQAILFMNDLAGSFTHRIVAYTQDYADHSPFLQRYRRKIKVIPPPVDLPVAAAADILECAKQFNPAQKTPVIGMVTRFATEKGVEVLINALPKILEVYPSALVLFAGAYQNIMGEQAYFEHLRPAIEKLEKEGHWKFVGNLNPRQISAFYPNIDVLVVPSLNSTESFGLVQIEAMINGKPSIASNLPGVRQPVITHKMGKIIPIGDAAALAQAVIDIVSNPSAYQGDQAAIRDRYLPDSIAAEYETLFNEMLLDLR